nr:CsiV family protein [Shewanella sp. NIFS-20-20]
MPTPIKTVVLVLFSSIAMGFMPSSYAKDAWFEVEIYVFSRDSQPQQIQEAFSDNTKLPNTRGSIDLITPEVAREQLSLQHTLTPCDANDWVTRAQECQQQQQGQAPTMIYPAPMPVQITTKSAGNSPAGVTAQEANPNANKAYLLAASHGQFEQYIKQLSKEPGTTGLLHMSWRQNMQPRRQASPIHLFGGKDFAAQYSVMGAAIDHDPSATTATDTLDNMDGTQSATPRQNSDNTDGQPMAATQLTQPDFLSVGVSPQAQQPVWQLDGDLLIYLEHFLYIETDLVLRVEGKKLDLKDAIHSYSSQQASAEAMSANLTQTPTAATTSPYLYALAMKQNRRVRSNELHYFDHPRFGMLIQIRKLEPSQSN